MSQLENSGYKGAALDALKKQNATSATSYESPAKAKSTKASLFHAQN